MFKNVCNPNEIIRISDSVQILNGLELGQKLIVRNPNEFKFQTLTVIKNLFYQNWHPGEDNACRSEAERQPGMGQVQILIHPLVQINAGKLMFSVIPLSVAMLCFELAGECLFCSANFGAEKIAQNDLQISNGIKFAAVMTESL